MKKYLPLFVVAFLGVCVLLMADVKTDYSHSVNFGQFHTYSWIKVQAGDQLWQQRITNDLDRTLQSKGWQKVDSNGDVGVTAFGSTKEQPTLNTFYDGFGGGWFWQGMGDSMATTTEEDTPVGTLVVDLFDTHTKKLIWRGKATNTLSGDAEKNEKKLAKTV